MKRCFYFLGMLMIILLASITVFSQTKVFEYDYDDSGNRIQRQFITLKSASVASSEENDFSKEMYEGLFGEGLIKIYPNPTKGALKVEVPLIALEQEVHISIFNMQGAKITSQLVTGQINTIDLKGQPSGVYIMKISSGPQVSEWKIIKE